MKYKILFIFLLIVVPLFAQNKNQPIGFKENKGQIIDQNGKPNNAVKYLLNSRGLNVQLKKNGFSYDIYETKQHPIKHHIQDKSAFSPLENNDKKVHDYTLEYIFHRIDIDFVNANQNVEFVTSEASTDYDNYYNVPNKPDGVTNVHQYNQITYKNIYPNIDVVFSIPKDTLKTVEYNFVVHPKGNILDIQLRFNGAKTELVDNKIRMTVRFGEMEETLPASWTEDGMSKKSITVGYTKIKKDVYGFVSNENVSNKTVIIDPVPVRLWGTYYGEINFTDNPNSINLDHLGNTIFTGHSESATNIATSGSFQSNLTGTGLPGSGFMAKLSPSGVRIWGTYLLRAGIQSAKINSQNQLYIGGYATAVYPGTLLSTPNSFKEIGETNDAILMKFNSNGQRIWGTFYGGQGPDRIDTISLDSEENIIIAGETHSEDGITTPDAFQNTLFNNNTSNDSGFFAKFNENGNRLYGSYFPFDIRNSTIDLNNNVIFTGNQGIIDASHPNVSTIGAFKTNLNSYDGFVVKFSPNFTRLWCTYYGGDKSSLDPSDNQDIINGVGIDDTNNIYIVGTTRSTNNISTPGAYKTSQNIQGQDAFIAKFNANGIRQWGTYFGDNSTLYTDSGTNCSISLEGNIYLIGYTDSQNNIATANSFQSVINGVDGYIAKFSTNGELNWSTYYGGKGGDFLKSIDLLEGKIVVSGRTVYDDSTDLSTPGAHKTNGGGSIDIFIAKFQDCLSSPIVTYNSPICVGKTLELKALGGTAYSWTGPNGFTSTDQNPTILNASALNSGQYSCSITGTGGCDDTKTIDVIVGDIEAPIPDLTLLPILTGDCNTAITTIPTATDNCAGAIIATTLNPLAYSLPGTYTVVWNYNDGNGNTSTQNQTITINNQPLPTSTSPQNFCIQQNPTFNNILITGQNIKWYDTLTNGTQSPNSTRLQNGTTYYASQTINGCESERIPVVINIQNTPAPTGDTNQSFCSTQNATLNNIEITGTNIKWYDNSNTELPNTTPISDNATYYATQTSDGCESINKILVNTFLINTLNATNYTVEFCDDANDGKEILDLYIYNQNLIANPAGNSFSYYNSLTSAENQIVNDQINTINNYVLPTGSHTLFVRIDSQNGCHQVVELNLKLYSKPKILINDIMPICEGSSITINTGAGYDNYLWSTAEISSTITIQNPGNYSVTVTNNYSTISCSSTKNFEVRKSNIATITSIDTQDWTDNQNRITVYVTSSGDFEYSTDGIHFQDSNQFSNLISGQYTVFVRDKNGCGTETDAVYLLMYPKFFTPNGDGFNDTWKIKFSDIEKGLTVKIFDRYGKFITELKNNSAWNGTFNGHELPATDYWFVVTRGNGTEFKGHFSLKR